ncbi:hypothetical protein BH09BAC2_BH09BAC2_11600 [soil metagenome]
MNKTLFTTLLLVFSFGAFSQKPAKGVLRPESIIQGTLVGVSPELRSLTPVAPVNFQASKVKNENPNPKTNVPNLNAISQDAALQTQSALKRADGSYTMAAPVASFDGNNNTQGYLPPDICGSIGPNHFVQMTNTLHSVYNKTGTRLSGPVLFSTIATGANATDDGDPIVLYDQQADRWMLMQFSNVQSGSDRLIFCVSKTADPSGAYWVYSFTTAGNMPDYPHVAIWNNMYTITTHEFAKSGTTYSFAGGGFYAIDRNKMLTGAATTTLVRFVSSADYGWLATSTEGAKTPDASAYPTFWGYESDETGGATDQLMYRNMSVDFANPTASWMSDGVTLPTAAFDGSYCQVKTAGVLGVTRNAIEQQGTTAGLDDISGHIMSRVVYRRFDTYEAIVLNHTVNVSGQSPITGKASYQAAIRWYELRRSSPATPWSIYQQSTYAPYPVASPSTGENIWLGSITLDQKGGIGMGYSRSSSSTYAGIYYTTRAATDPLNTMGAEGTIMAGLGSQTSTSYRFGDYSAISANPSGDTLWYTNQYFSAAGAWRTRIGAFIITTPVTPAVHFKDGGMAVTQPASSTLVPGRTCLKYKDYTATIMIDQAPSGPVTVNFTTSGTATLGKDYDLIYTAPLTLSSANMSRTISIRVYDDAQNEPEEYAYIGYTLTGANGVAATYNQVFQLTIAARTDVTPVTFTTKTYGTAAAVFSDNFESATVGTRGVWTQQSVFLTAGGTNPNNFVVGTNGGAGFTSKSMYITNDGSTYAYTFPSGASYTVAKIRIVSPDIDITGKGQVTVSFTYKCNGEANYDFGAVWYSLDGGTNWSTDGTKLQLVTTATAATITLPASAENISNLKIAFQFEADDNTGTQPPLGIDNVVVNAKPVIYSNPQIQTALNAGTATCFNFGPFQTVNFYDKTTNKIMATIVNNSAFDFGGTTVSVDRSGTGAVAFNSNVTAENLASKTFKVVPEFTDPSASYTITLYYTEAEIAGWEAATGNTRSGMLMVKVSGPTNSVGDVTPANAGSYSYIITPSTLGAFTPTGVTFQATFTGFSGFGVGKPSAPIPVTLVQFKGEHVVNRGNKLTWVVTNQVNVHHYELQYSTDGQQFSSVATVAAKAAGAGQISYDNLHVTYMNGNNYYRLKSVDIDGKLQFSSIININVNQRGSSVIVYPNPVADKLMINYRGVSANVNVEILDAVGKLIYNSKTVVTNPISIPVQNLSSGNYILRITDESGVLNTKFLKQ